MKTGLELKQGQHVTFNGGYPGIVRRRYSERMYEVGTGNNLSCVDISDIEIVLMDEVNLKKRGLKK